MSNPTPSDLAVAESFALQSAPTLPRTKWGYFTWYSPHDDWSWGGTWFDSEKQARERAGRKLGKGHSHYKIVRVDL